MFQLDALAHAWPVEWYDELDSTSALAARRAADGLVGPIWFAAKRQTAGRGRLGRKWESKSGNLFATSLIPVSEVSSAVAGVSLGVGLAVRDTIVELTQGQLVPGLKWPNDVRVDGAKLCGILLESGRRGRAEDIWMSIGIGINLAFAPEIPGYPTVSINGLLPSVQISPETALSALDDALRKRLAQFTANGMTSVTKDWLAASDQKGALCRVKAGNSLIEGYFVGLDEYGHMCLKPLTGDVVTITAGDVELVKEG